MFGDGGGKEDDVFEIDIFFNEGSEFWCKSVVSNWINVKIPVRTVDITPVA